MSGSRVAVLTPYGPGRPGGGVEVFNQCLARALGPIEIFADSRGNGDARGTDLRRVGLEQPVAAVRAARTLLRRHREDPFDVIISNGVSGWPLTLSNPGVPLIQVYHFTMAGLARQALSLRGDRVTTGRVTAMFDRLAGMGKHVVAVSHRVLHEVESFYRLKGRFIPNAVDIDAFHPSESRRAREALGLPLETPIGIFVGRPDHSKGYDILLRVADQLPEVLFLVAGGPAEVRKNVRSLGRIAHPELPDWYAASDFFFLPSRYEGFSLSLLEALACDLPAVVSDAACPFPDGLGPCGIAVPGAQAEDFARAIRRVLAARAEFAPRDFILPRYNFDVFRHRWRGLVGSLVGGG